MFEQYRLITEGLHDASDIFLDSLALKARRKLDEAVEGRTLDDIVWQVIADHVETAESWSVDRRPTYREVAKILGTLTIIKYGEADED